MGNSINPIRFAQQAQKAGGSNGSQGFGAGGSSPVSQTQGAAAVSQPQGVTSQFGAMKAATGADTFQRMSGSQTSNPDALTRSQGTTGQFNPLQANGAGSQNAFAASGTAGAFAAGGASKTATEANPGAVVSAAGQIPGMNPNFNLTMPNNGPRQLDLVG